MTTLLDYATGFHGNIITCSKIGWTYVKIQYRHLIPTSVDLTSASAWLYKHHGITCQNICQAHQCVTHVACKLIHLCSVVRSSMHSSPRNWMAIRRAVVKSCRATYTFSAGIKCWHSEILEREFYPF